MHTQVSLVCFSPQLSRICLETTAPRLAEGWRGWTGYDNASHLPSCEPCHLVVDRSSAANVFTRIPPLDMLLQTSCRFSGAVLGGIKLPTIYSRPGHCEAATHYMFPVLASWFGVLQEPNINSTVSVQYTTVLGMTCDPERRGALNRLPGCARAFVLTGFAGPSSTRRLAV